jgi:hypothetical protein
MKSTIVMAALFGLALFACSTGQGTEDYPYDQTVRASGGGSGGEGGGGGGGGDDCDPDWETCDDDGDDNGGGGGGGCNIDSPEYRLCTDQMARCLNSCSQFPPELHNACMRGCDGFLSDCLKGVPGC